MGKPRYKFAELVDIAQLQALMDRFSAVIGISNSIVDVDGTRLTSSGCEDACTHYHRAHPASCRRCAASDTSLLDSSSGKSAFVIFRCPNGLIDSASPIIVEGEHLASVFAGQVLTEPPDVDYFRRQAQQYGYDETGYLDAINRVPRRSADCIESASLLFSQIAGILAEIGLNRLRQMKAAEVLAELNKTLESKVSERTRALAEATAAGIACVCVNIGTDQDDATLRQLYGDAAYLRSADTTGIVGPMRQLMHSALYRASLARMRRQTVTP